ncbi:hypothetical protein AAF712_004053 [Marasmius tenuissimus]|uniref:FCP1 homology domain-containing protein n=1 Tax=Marasmius tenuissimus TaxID=585030 RepID=A0ABR3A6V3_9AGAR
MASSSSSPSIRQRLLSLSSRRSSTSNPPTSHPQESTEATTSTSATLAPPSTSTPASATTPEDEESNSHSREQGSLNDNSTLTSSQNKHSSKSFYRRRNKSSEQSLGTESNPHPTKASKSSSKSSPSQSRSKAKSKQRPSLLTRVVYKVVPCVGSQQLVTPIEADPASQRSADVKQPVPPPSAKPTASQSVADQNHASTDTPMQEIALTPLTPPAAAPSPTTATPVDPEADVIIQPPLSAQLLPPETTDGVTSGAVQPPGSTGLTPANGTSPLPTTPDAVLTRTTTRDTQESEETHMTESVSAIEDEEEERLIRNGGVGIPLGPDGTPMPLLPPIAPEHAGRKCLVLDLDETLVHSSFKPIPSPDFIVPVEIEYHWHHFHVLKRPGVDLFLQEMGKVYEVVVFTASLSKYADPVLDQLDTSKVVAHRLFRESCYSHKGNYVKDLSQLGRPLSSTIILDNSPASYIFHPHNAVPVSSWFNDPHDAELPDLIPFLVDLAPESVGDVRGILNLARE